VLCVAAATPAFAQTYEITWSTVDGGASMGAAGGPYVLDSTSGQPDAGPPAQGGPFSLGGGFWPVTLPSVPTADLSLTQTDSPDPVIGLQPLTYTLAVTNAGPVAATNVTVTDTLPASAVFQSAGGSGWSCGEAGGTVTCTRASLPVGQAPALAITVTAPPTAQTLTNRATVAAEENDPASSNNSDTEQTTVTAATTADLRIVKSDGGATATWGQPLTYTITASNAGPAAITGALVADAFPAALAGVVWSCSATAGSSCPASGAGNLNQAVNLLAGGAATFTATGMVVPGSYAPLVNTATIGVPAGVFDPLLANNTSVETTPVVPPDLIFEDGFDAGTLEAWSSTSGQGLSVSRGAAFSGPFGLRVRLSGTTPQFVQDDSPFAESRYRARFYVRLPRLRMSVADEFELFTAYAPAGQAKVRLLLAAGAAQKSLRLAVVLDDGSVVQTPAGSEAALGLDWHALEIDWQAASAPGANDGRLDLWVDGLPQPSLHGLDTDEARIGAVRWGAVAGLDAGTSGSFALDEFVSRRQTMTGLLSSSADVPPTTREQMAALLARAEDGGERVPTACTVAPFGDVPASSPFCPWIRELVARGITGGCGGGNYCPAQPVTRAEVAALLLVTREGPGYVPPACTTAPFLDVPAGSPYCPWIQELVTRGITGGCGDGNYCPDGPVPRGQMAALLSLTLGLTVPLP
jgi:uncharacterized repeat protein (TIGR01451 family)